MKNVLVVFGREEARQRWLRNCVTSGQVNHCTGAVDLGGVRVITCVATADKLDYFRGIEVSAVFEDATFTPFAGWHETIASRVRE